MNYHYVFQIQYITLLFSPPWPHSLIICLTFPLFLPISFTQIGTSASRWARSDGPSRPVSRWSFAAPLRPRTSLSVSSQCRGSSAAHRWPWWALVPCLSWDPITLPVRRLVKWPYVKRAPTCTCSSCSTYALKMLGNTSAEWQSGRRHPQETSSTAARGLAMSRLQSSHLVSNCLFCLYLIYLIFSCHLLEELWIFHNNSVILIIPARKVMLCSCPSFFFFLFLLLPVSPRWPITDSHTASIVSSW